METNMAFEVRPDRKIWFSMWFLGAIASFGVAFFPFFYFSVDRRNRHFRRQQEFERKVAMFFSREWDPASVSDRNAKLWAASIILIAPVFVLAYLLSEDFNEHEERQCSFLGTFYPERMYVPQWISIKTYAFVTLATLGLGVVYWLYKIVNVYNNHFKEQFHIEHELTQLMEAKSRTQSV